MVTAGLLASNVYLDQEGCDVGCEVRRHAAGAPPDDDRKVLSEELFHAGIRVFRIVNRRLSV